MQTAPIVLFTYNRLWHTQQTIASLQANSLASASELFIYSDAAKHEKDITTVSNLRSYLKTVDGFKKVTIIEQNENQGLSKSILSGVDAILDTNNAVIVVEDDLKCSPHFLAFLNEGLQKFESDKNVACIHAYCYPIPEQAEPFFIRGADCWGWATWKDTWQSFERDGQTLLNELKEKNLTSLFDFNDSYPYTKMLQDQILGKNDSWAVRWKASTFLKKQLCLYYKHSLVQNIGNDNSGTHSTKTDHFYVDLKDGYEGIGNLKIEESIIAREAFAKFYRNSQPSFLEKLKAKIKSLGK